MIDLASLEFSEKTGFLPESDPLMRFTDRAVADWEHPAQHLPKLLVSSQLHVILENLAPFPLDKIDSRAEEERAMLLLSYLGHAYVWSGMPPATKLPESIAVPWYEISQKIGRPPVLSYASYALHNWRRIDPVGPIELGNICLLQNFMAGVDEEWFILIHVAIEAEAGPALLSLLKAAESTGSDVSLVTKNIERANGYLTSVNAIMDRMPEYCDPYIYYNRVRPYIHGWKNNPALPDGLTYEGVSAYDDKGQFFRGETGAQSTIVPCLDAILGIEHKDDPLKEYLLEMQDYMPPGHRELINKFKEASNLREYVITHKGDAPELVAAYNKCVTLVEQFRDTHLKYASSYINKQTQTSDANPTQIGTGGTPFMPYLKKHRDESGEHLIS